MHGVDGGIVNQPLPQGRELNGSTASARTMSHSANMAEGGCAVNGHPKGPR